MLHSANQLTLRSAISCSGVGLHSGEVVRMRLLPAEADTGILFRRMDVTAKKSLVPARYDLVTETTLGTTIQNEYGTKVATIEHLMAALWGAGVDNVIVELDGPEVPIMDGSSEPFMFLLDCAGLEIQDAPRQILVIDQEITYSEGDMQASLQPYDGFVLDVEINFPHAMISRQRTCIDFSCIGFKQSLSRARTFGFEAEVEKLRLMGLARGGSLDNAIVLGKDTILNEEGLRFNDEFVRHKALDCLGDYFLSQYRIQGKLSTKKPGHGINNRMLRALFAQPEAWHLETAMIENASFAEMPRASGVTAFAHAVMQAPKD